MKLYPVLFLLLFITIMIPANAVCWAGTMYEEESGLLKCTGTLNKYENGKASWPRLPTNTEIESARQDFEQYWRAQKQKNPAYFGELPTYITKKRHECKNGIPINNVNVIGVRDDYFDDGYGLVYNPSRDNFEFLVSFNPPLVHPISELNNYDYFNGWATESTCGYKGPGSSQVPPEDNIPWVVVIGAIGALGVAAVAGAKVLGKKPPAPQKPSTPREKEKEKKKPVQYILQFLPESLAKTAVAGVVHLQAGPGESASFTVVVKKRLQDGTITSAPEAQISIVPKPGTEGISVAPSRGSGQVSCTVSVDKNVTAETGELVVSVTGAGGGFSTNVIVDIDQNYRVEFE